MHNAFRFINDDKTAHCCWLFICFAVWGCQLTPSDGQFHCIEQNDCPDNWICHQDDDGQSRCYKTPIDGPSDSEVAEDTLAANPTDTTGPSTNPDDTNEETDTRDTIETDTDVVPETDTSVEPETDTVTETDSTEADTATETDTGGLLPCPEDQKYECKNAPACKHEPNYDYYCAKVKDVCCPVQ